MNNTQSPAPGVAAIVEQLMGIARDMSLAEVDAHFLCPQDGESASPEYIAADGKYVAARNALREALRTALQASAAAVEQQPVMWRRPWNGDESDLGTYVYANDESEKDDDGVWQPLFTGPMTPQQKEELSNYLASLASSFAASQLPAKAQEADPREIRVMLQSLQAGEMTVSRAIELLEMWLAGKYSDDQVPPPPADSALITDDKFPMELVRELRAELASRTPAPGMAQAVHYPQCWDTAAYPTLESALKEMAAWFKCSTCGFSHANGTAGCAPGMAGGVGADK